MHSPAISPDGARVAFIDHTPGGHTAGGSYVYVVRLANNQADAVIGVEESRARALTWANNDTLILLVSETNTLHFAARMVEQFVPFAST